ncbi:MAG: chemotaxis protein CheB [Alkalispirochaeta sp.]
MQNVPPANTESAPTKLAPSHIVAIGASAGGLEAIEAFFTHVPEDSPFAYVVIQHLSPDYKSLMVEILSKKTTMPVLRAEDGMNVDRSAVYLIPPKKNLTIFHGKLVLSEQDHTQGLNLPIDVFLRSLSEDQGEKAIAVILSGTGSDGTRGGRSVKEKGGIIVVQDVATAKFDGMPAAAIATGLADFILPPAEMPAELLAFTAKPRSSSPGGRPKMLSDEDGMNRVFALLREQFKVDFSLYKKNTVSRRLDRRMTINQIEDIREYASLLQRVPSELNTLFRELLIGVTSFFRDPQIFERLAQEVVDEIVEAGDEREIRVWVSGCSTGEEAYTLAIILRERMEHAGVSRDVKIFATDIDRNAIHFAAVGSYPESIAADIPGEYLAKYFYKRDDHFQITRTIREMVVFAAHNLVKDPPFTNIDLVSCRNLLIYLELSAQVKVLQNFSFSLVRNGILLLGSSESIGEMTDLFEPIHAKSRIFRSRGSGRSYAAFGGGGAGDTRAREQSYRYAAARRAARGNDDAVLERFVEAVSGDYLPTAVILNEQQEVLHVIGDAERFFRFPTGRPSMELDKVVVKGLSVPISTGVQKAFRNRKGVVFTGVVYSDGGETRRVDIRIAPLPDRPTFNPLVAVLINDAHRVPTSSTDTIETYDVSEQTQQRIDDLEQELQFTRESLQATIEELETANEELQATNEELMASNEELQSTNEELQSTNEELYTVNSEYQNKIVELTELNNDVENLLQSSNIGTLLLDENLTIRRFSQEAGTVFRLKDGDIGRPIEHIAHNLDSFDPYAAIRKVVEAGAKREWPVCSGGRSWHLFRVTPYRISPSETAGVIVSIVDITELKTAEEERARSQEILSHVSDTSPALVWMSDVTKACMWFNRTWLNFTGRTFEEEEGYGWTEGVHPDDYDRCLQIYVEAFDARRPFSMEYRLRRHDGEYRWILDKGTPRYSGTAEFLGYVGSCLDVTEQREDRQELEASRERYQTLLESVSAVPWEYDIASDRWTYVAPQVSHILGYPPEEWTDLQSWAERVHPDDRAWAAEYCAASTARGEAHVFEYRFITKEGETVWIRDVVDVEMHDGTPTTIRGFMLDITKRKHDEQKLTGILQEGCGDNGTDDGNT